MDIDVKKESRNLKKYAYHEIKNKIVNCIYQPGSVLTEQLLATELDISRTPIREALNQLHHEGLIRILPKKGILVSNITIADMSQIYQVRLEIEPFVIRISGPHLDKEKLLQFREQFVNESNDGDSMEQLETDTGFHRYCADNCGNKYIIQLMNKVLDENKRVIISTQNEVRLSHSREEHIQIIDLLVTEDYEAASSTMRSHIENCRDSAFYFFLNRAKT
jgi:DNA-binding GntR family transcriptional regulator